MLVRGGDGGKSVVAVTGRGDNNKRAVVGDLVAAGATIYLWKNRRC